MSVGLFQRCDLLQVFGDGDVQCRLLDRFAGCFKPGASRNGSQALSDGVEADVRVSSAGPFSCPGSVDTSMAGFGWARLQPPGSRAGMPAAFKWVATVSRRMCTARSIRLRDQPSRPQGLAVCFLRSRHSPPEDNPPSQSMSWISYLVGRFSGVHRWPVLGVHRGW
jgi:hypothetical protein